MIGGSRIPDNKINRDVIAVLENYRQAVERADAEALMLMASPNYREDSGTPSMSDDYGFDGLRAVLTERLGKARDIRYFLRYMSMRLRCPTGGTDLETGCRANVEVLIDASFTVTDARGQDQRPDMRDQNELELEWTGDKWLIVRGM